MRSFFVKIDFESFIKRELSNFSLRDNDFLRIESDDDIFYESNDCHNIYYDEVNQILVGWLGYISNISEVVKKFKLNTQEVNQVLISIFLKEKEKMVIEFEGMFMFYFFQLKTKKMFFFQSAFGYSLPLYYFHNDDFFILSTSLKKILPYISSDTRSFDKESIFIFLNDLNYIFQNQKTLITGINKLFSNKFLSLDVMTKKILITSPPSWKVRVCFKDVFKELLPSIRMEVKNVLGLIKKDQVIGSTVTGGWDSLLNLSILKEIPEKRVQGVVINGGGNSNELLAAEKTNSNFNEQPLIIESVSEEIFKDLPQIVWIYEGYVFQEGMFLRYQLAKLLKDNNLTNCVLGTGADQVLFNLNKKFNLLRIVKNRSKQFIKLFLTFFRRENQKKLIFSKISFREELVSYNHIDFNLKMHEIMLNYNSILGIYPFLNKRTYLISEKLGFLNFKKRYYKYAIKKLLSKDKCDHIKKSGFVVDTYSLFNSNKELLLGVLERDSLKEFLSNEQIDCLKSFPDKNYMLILKLNYLFIFQKLFLSGEFDGHFDGKIDFSEHDFCW